MVQFHCTKGYLDFQWCYRKSSVKLSQFFYCYTTLLYSTFLYESLTVTLNSPLLGLFLSSDASVCATMAFPPLWNSDHVVVSVSIDFPSNSQRNVSFHHIVYDYFCADWDGLRDHLRDVPLENFVSEFMLKLMYISFIISIRSSLIHLHGFKLVVPLP